MDGGGGGGGGKVAIGIRMCECVSLCRRVLATVVLVLMEMAAITDDSQSELNQWI